jgi:DNA-binding LacI/PurR family transcriptional regulator
VLAWDDSPLCQLVTPSVTAFTHDVMAEAGETAGLLCSRIETGVDVERWMAAPQLTVRASTSRGTPL